MKINTLLSMKRSLSQKESFNKANLLIRDSSISEGLRIYKSVLADTAHTNEGWYDVAVEQLYNAGRYNEAYEISKLKVIKRSGKINKTRFVLHGSCFKQGQEI